LGFFIDRDCKLVEKYAIDKNTSELLNFITMIMDFSIRRQSLY